MTKSSWAILLCKFNNDDSEPFPRNYYKDLFTSSGNGSQNMVDFFRDVSHGTLDLSDSHVFGWYTLNKSRSEYGTTGAEMLGNRDNLINWAKQAAAAKGDIISGYVSYVVCMNIPTDLFGGGNGVVCDNNSMTPSLLGQEMGHFYGLAHSRADPQQPCGNDSGLDYKDFWDVMSTAGCAHMAPHPRFGSIGPGLNAANMASRGWLNESRVWKTNDKSFETLLKIRPLHRYDLPGYLAARFGEYLIEFRSKANWDAAIPRSAVLIHRFEDNQSYLLSANNGDQDLVADDIFGTSEQENRLTTILNGLTRIEVVEINGEEQFALIRLVKRPAFEEPSLNGILFGGVTRGGGGHVFVPGTGFIPIPPHSPFVKVLNHVATYESSGAIASTHLRNAVRLETLTAIAALVENEIKELQGYESPPPLQTHQT